MHQLLLLDRVDPLAVLQQPIVNEVHLVGSMPLGEDVLISHERELLKAGVADRAHCRNHTLHLQLVEERVPRDRGHVHLVLQLHLHHVRQRLEELRIAAHLALLALLQLLLTLLQVAPHPHGERHGDMVLTEEATHLAVLRLLGGVDLAQVRHGLGDAADERGERDQGKHDHEDGEDALDGVPRLHLHGSRCELRERPMQRREVAIGQLVLIIFERLLSPPPWEELAGSDQVPETRNEVVHEHDQEDEFEDVDQRQHVLRVDPLEQLGDEGVELEETHQADEAHEAENTTGLQDPQVVGGF
mmetsp:Transcript_4885/g.12573  ORF Transcript_4885/g.12573 Transcript_4885/m.12573 type:complete len:301 (+) Transcript_4885:716-1618(+)